MSDKPDFYQLFALILPVLQIRFVLLVGLGFDETGLPVVLFYQLDHQGWKDLINLAFAEHHRVLVQCVFVQSCLIFD